MPRKLFSEPLQDWLLPERPYVPGRTPRPSDDNDVHRIARAAPVPTDPLKWRTNRAWIAGVRLYQQGYFWEAHEVWEKVWMNARPNSPERSLVQGVIQLANAALKQRMDRIGASRRLGQMATTHIDEAATSGCIILMGVELSALQVAIGRFIVDLKPGRETPAPELRLVG